MNKPITTLIYHGIKDHDLLLGPCQHDWCTLLHYYCSCCEWQGSTILSADANVVEFKEHILEIQAI